MAANLPLTPSNGDLPMQLQTVLPQNWPSRNVLPNISLCSVLLLSGCSSISGSLSTEATRENSAPPSLTVNSSGTPSTYGGPVTFTATASTGLSGTVLFYDAGSLIGTGTLTGNTAAITTSTLAVRAHAISASLQETGNLGSLTSNSIIQTVVPVSISMPAITWATPATIAFGTPLGAAQLDATANVPGTFVYSPALGSILNSGPQILSVTFTPTDAADYKTAAATVILNVINGTHIAPAVTWATPTPIAFGTPLSATQLDAAANVPGTFVYSPALGTVMDTGSKILSATFTPADTTGYTSATATVTLTVVGPTVTVAGPSTAMLAGTSYAFAATVTGSTETNVLWSAGGTIGGYPQIGLITSSGVYTAPRTLYSEIGRAHV